MNKIFLIFWKSIKDTFSGNLFNVIMLIILALTAYKIVDYLVHINEYKKSENHIAFRDLGDDFIFSPINLEIVYEHRNSNYRNYIQLDFNVTRVDKKKSFIISTHKPLRKRPDSNSVNMQINDIIQNDNYNQYSFIFDQNKTEAKVSLKLEGDIFGGNKYHKEFLLYLDIDAPKNIKKQIKIKPILNAVKNVSLVDKSELFVIQEDNPYYRLGKPVYADKFRNLFLRFIDLEKQEVYQTHLVLLSTLLGVLLSILFNILFKISSSYQKYLKYNKKNIDIKQFNKS